MRLNLFRLEEIHPEVSKVRSLVPRKNGDQLFLIIRCNQFFELLQYAGHILFIFIFVP